MRFQGAEIVLAEGPVSERPYDLARIVDDELGRGRGDWVANAEKEKHLRRVKAMHDAECERIERWLETTGRDCGFYPAEAWYEYGNEVYRAKPYRPAPPPYMGDNGLSAFFSKSRKRKTARRKPARRTVSRAGKPMRGSDGYRLYMMRGDGARARIHLAGPEPESSEEAFARFKSQYPLTYHRTRDPDCKGYHIWTRENWEWEDRTDFYEDEPLYFWLVSDSSLRSRSARHKAAPGTAPRKGAAPKRTVTGRRRRCSRARTTTASGPTP